MRLAKSWEIVAAVVTFTSVLGAQTNPPREPVARIGDQPIYDEELLPSITGQLWQLKNQEYDLKIKALESLLNQRTLEAAAKSKGLSNDAFLEQTVDRNVPAPSAAEVEGYGWKSAVASTLVAPIRGRSTAEVPRMVDVLLFVVEQEGKGACHTGERSCFFRAFGGGAEPGPV